MQHSGQQALFVCLCLHCLTFDAPLESLCNQLKGLCNDKRFFRGMLGIATTDSLGQESELLTIRPAPDNAPNYHVLPLDAGAAWSQFAKSL